jgi:hypothetical protein
VTTPSARATLLLVSAPQPSRKPTEAPEVEALRKKIRGEPLNDEERALLARATRKPSGPGIPHATIEAELAERQRHGK